MNLATTTLFWAFVHVTFRGTDAVCVLFRYQDKCFPPTMVRIIGKTMSQ